jgi:hypothetical protein
MAGLADAATDRVSVASAPSLATWSVCCWAKVAASASFSPMVRVEAAGGTAMVFGFKSLTPSLYSAASTTGINGTAVTLGAYVFIGATRNGTTCALYQGVVGGASLTKVTGTVNSSGTPDTWTAYGRSPSDGSEWFSGTQSLLRTWGAAVLTDVEMDVEFKSATAVKTGAWGNWPLGNNGSGGVSLLDISGNARHLVAGSTPLTLSADPTFGNALGRASETDTAAALGRQKIVVLGRAIETDTGRAVTRQKLVAVGRASGTGSAIGLARSKSVSLNRSTEVDIAQVVTRSKSTGVGRATEADANTVLGRTKATNLPRVQEVDNATLLARVKAVLLQRASEVDSSSAVTLGRQTALGRAVETDTATLLSRGKSVALGLASTTSTAGSLSRLKSVTIGSVLGSNSAFPLSTSKAPVVLGRAVEVDGAVAVTTGLQVNLDVEPGPVRALWAAGPAMLRWECDNTSTEWWSGGARR